MKQASLLYKMHQCECYFDDSQNGGIFNAIKVTCQMLKPWEFVWPFLDFHAKVVYWTISAFKT